MCLHVTAAPSLYIYLVLHMETFTNHFCVFVLQRLLLEESSKEHQSPAVFFERFHLIFLLLLSHSTDKTLKWNIYIVMCNRYTQHTNSFKLAPPLPPLINTCIHQSLELKNYNIYYSEMLHSARVVLLLLVNYEFYDANTFVLLLKETFECRTFTCNRVFLHSGVLVLLLKYKIWVLLPPLPAADLNSAFIPSLHLQTAWSCRRMLHLKPLLETSHLLDL